MQGGIGLQGAIGQQGSGAQGAIGPQGNVGVQGVIGSQGSGTQGVIGPQGNIGVQGVIGSQGAIELLGAIGPQGFIGPQGVFGFQGIIGPQGSGTQGAIGQQGVVGPQGLTGPQGPVLLVGDPLLFGFISPSIATVLSPGSLAFTIGFGTSGVFGVPVGSIGTATGATMYTRIPRSGVIGNLFASAQYNSLSAAPGGRSRSSRRSLSAEGRCVSHRRPHLRVRGGIVQHDRARDDHHGAVHSELRPGQRVPGHPGDYIAVQYAIGFSGTSETPPTINDLTLTAPQCSRHRRAPPSPFIAPPPHLFRSRSRPVPLFVPSLPPSLSHIRCRLTAFLAAILFPFLLLGHSSLRCVAHQCASVMFPSEPRPPSHDLGEGAKFRRAPRFGVSSTGRMGGGGAEFRVGLHAHPVFIERREGRNGAVDRIVFSVGVRVVPPYLRHPVPLHPPPSSFLLSSFIGAFRRAWFIVGRPCASRAPFPISRPSTSRVSSASVAHHAQNGKTATGVAARCRALSSTVSRLVSLLLSLSLSLSLSLYAALLNPSDCPAIPLLWHP